MVSVMIPGSWDPAPNQASCSAKNLLLPVFVLKQKKKATDIPLAKVNHIGGNTKLETKDLDKGWSLIRAINAIKSTIRNLYMFLIGEYK